MTSANRPLTPERPRSVLRCPACSSYVEMPARRCPRCDVDLSTAYIKIKKRRPALAPTIKGAMAVTAVAALAAASAVWEPSEEPPLPPATEAEIQAVPPMRIIEGAPPGFSRLAAEYPILLKPYVIAYEVRAAVMKANERLERRERLLEELDVVISDLGLGDDDDLYSVFVKVPPGQRTKMLLELDRVYGDATDGK